jgi:ABC-type glycerol-3-phosphate transport system substrate-binding protein
MDEQLSRRKFLKWSASAAAGGLLAACAPEPERIVETVEVPGETVVETVEVPVEGETVVVTATPAPPEAVTIRFIATAPPEYYRIDVFSEEHPYIDVDFEDIGDEAFDEVVLTSVASGDPPELAWASGQGLWRFVQVGAAMEIGDLMKASPHPERDMIDPKAIAQFNSPGFFPEGLVMIAPGQYGWPVYNTFFIMIYNKRILDDAGVEYPQRGWTWDDWRGMLQQVSAPADNIHGFVLPGGSDTPNFVHNMLWTNGASVYDSEGNCTLAAAPAVETLSFIQQLITQDNTVILASGAEGGDFLGGNVGFMYWGNFIVGWFDSALADPYGIVPMPVSTQEAMFDNVDGFMFLTGSANPLAGWEYAKWLTSTEGQKVLNDADEVEVLSVNMTAAKDAYVNPNFGIPEGAEDWFLSMPFSDAAHYRPWIPVGPGFNYDTAYDPIWLGDPVEGTLDQIASTIDSLNSTLDKFG